MYETLASLLLAGPALCASPQAAHTRVQVVDGMTRIPRTGEVRGTSEARLFAARNEHEPFQLVVSACGEPLTITDISISELRGPREAKLAGAKLYREHYVPVTELSPLSQLAPGDYADALIPHRHPQSGQPLEGALYDALPFELAEAHHQPFWIELYVPRNAPAGDYHGEVTVTTGDGAQTSLPITLVVWNFTLPDVPALGSDFGLNSFDVARIHGLDPERDARTLNPLVRAYYDLLLDHQLSPSFLFDTQPHLDRASGELSFETSYAGLGTAAEGLDHYLNVKHAASYTYIFWERSVFSDPLGGDRDAMKSFLSGYVGFLKQHGWSERAHMPYGFLDEPSSQEAYAEVRAWGQLFNEVQAHTNSSAPLMITEQPEPEDSEWGSLDGFVDIWVPEFNAIWLDEHAGGGALAKQLTAGNQVWSYAALAYVPDEWWEAHPDTEVLRDSHPPKWLTDYAPINFRIPAWLNSLAGLTGLLYWDTIWSAEGVDVWRDAGTYHHEDPNNPEDDGLVLNGEGFLIYPGRNETLGFEGPVPSIRLKWFREAVEDYAYIQLLREAGEWRFAQEQIHSFARGVGDWRDDVPALYSARHTMGERLSARAGGER